MSKSLINETILAGDQLSSSWLIPAFTFPPQSQYTFKFTALSMENSNTISSTTFNITVLVSNLLTIIRGGNRNAGFSSQVLIYGRSSDPDLSDADN